MCKIKGNWFENNMEWNLRKQNIFTFKMIDGLVIDQ